MPTASALLARGAVVAAAGSIEVEAKAALVVGLIALVIWKALAAPIIGPTTVLTTIVIPPIVPIPSALAPAASSGIVRRCGWWGAAAAADALQLLLSLLEPVLDIGKLPLDLSNVRTGCRRGSRGEL